MLEVIMDNDYKQKVANFEEEKVNENSIVVLGDSIINYWKTNQFYKNEIINRGIAGDTTEGVLKRLDQIIKIKPKIVILNVGTNDLVRLKDHECLDCIVRRILKIKYLLEENILGVKVYVVSLLPVLHNSDKTIKEYLRNRSNEDIDQINEELSLFTNLIDVNSYLKDLDGNLKYEYTTDGIHLTKEGYKIYSKIIQKHIQELEVL